MHTQPFLCFYVCPSSIQNTFDHFQSPPKCVHCHFCVVFINNINTSGHTPLQISYLMNTAKRTPGSSIQVNEKEEETLVSKRSSSLTQLNSCWVRNHSFIDHTYTPNILQTCWALILSYTSNPNMFWFKMHVTFDTTFKPVSGRFTF